MEKDFGNTSLYNLTLLWEAPKGFLGSMLRLQDLHHHKQTFAIWSWVLLGITHARFIWRFSKWNTIYMQSPSKVARCLNGTLLISWSIFVDSPQMSELKEAMEITIPRLSILWWEELMCREENGWLCGHTACCLLDKNPIQRLVQPSSLNASPLILEM